MKRFSDFNIQITSKAFEGDKITILKVLDKEIIVHDFKVEESKCYKDRGNGLCLYLQISYRDEKRIIFTSSGYLQELIKQVPKSEFPFTTTIIKENECFKFS